MNFSDLTKRLKRSTHKNSPAILTGLGVAGVVSTAFLTAKATWEAKTQIDREEDLCERRLDTREKVEHCWKLYIPPVTTASATIFAIVASNRVATGRAVAATAAYSLTEQAFSEYREKVTDLIGDRKEQAIRDEITKDRIERNEPSVIVAGGGSVLCLEGYTGRYFMCDMDSLRRAENEINSRICQALYVTLDDFYDLVKLDHTSNSDRLGWDSDKLLALEFSTQLAGDGRPCIVFDYNYVKPI